MLQASWSDINESLRVGQLNKIDWVQAILQGQLTLPFAITQIGRKREADISPMDCATYIYPVASYYVFSTQTGVTDQHATAEAKMQVMRDALLRTNTASINFQVVKQPEIDVSDDNPVNAILFARGVGAYAGCIMTDLYVGETIY